MKKIGFDFDKVFVSYPPFIPDFIIDFMYKKRNGKLKYRYPGVLEKNLRIFSHNFIFRPPLQENIMTLKKISSDKNNSVYLISSRFSFLRNKTDNWLKKTSIKRYFKEVYFNYNDLQPHKFKDSIIKKEEIQDFIDDDFDLLLYLSRHNPKVKFYWVNRNNNSKVTDNIIGVSSIREYREKYL